MAILDPAPLVQHVFFFRRGGIRTAVGGYVRPHCGEEIGTGSGILNGGSQASILVLMLQKDFAMAREIGLFEGRGRQGGFGVEKAREL